MLSCLNKTIDVQYIPSCSSVIEIKRIDKINNIFIYKQKLIMIIQLIIPSVAFLGSGKFSNL